MSTFKSEQSFSSSQTTIIKSSSDNKIGNVSKLQRILWLGNLLYYQLVAVLTVVMLWIFFYNNQFSSLIFWHIVLSTIAYVPLMAVAIIAFSKDNLPTLQILRTKVNLIHGALLTLSCAAVTIGISVEIGSKNKNGYEHFTSNHAILGLASWILVLCSVFLGILAANTQVFAQYIKPVVTKLLHNFLGISAFILGVWSLVLMYPSGHYKKYLYSSAYYTSYYVTGYIVIWSLLAALRSLYSQVKNVVS